MWLIMQQLHRLTPFFPLLPIVLQAVQAAACTNDIGADHLSGSPDALAPLVKYHTIVNVTETAEGGASLLPSLLGQPPITASKLG